MTQSAASHRVLIFVVGRFHGWNCILGGDRDVFRDFRVLPLPPFLLHLDKSVDMSRDGNTGCQDMSRWSRCGFWAEMFSKLADRPTEALLWMPWQAGSVSMSHPNLIPSMPWWVYFAVFFTFFHCLSIFAFHIFSKNRYVRGTHLRFPEIFPPNFCGPPVVSGLVSPQSLLRFISAINHSLVHQLQQIWSNHIHPGLVDATKNPWEFFTALGSRSIESSTNFHRRPSNPLQTARAPAWWAIWASPSDRVATAGHRSAEAPGRATHGAPLPLMLHRLWMCWSKNGDGIPPKKMRDRGMIN